MQGFVFLFGAEIATKADLHKWKEQIMSAISNYTDEVNTKFTEIGTSVDGIVADVASLKATIDALQNSSGAITPADQALLDQSQAKVAALANRLKALDEATAPAEVPVPTPTT